MNRITPEHVIYGHHAAEAALANPLRILRHAYVTENAHSKLEKFLVSRAVNATLCKPGDLDKLVGGDAVHQGVVLHAEPLAQPSLEQFLDQHQNDLYLTVAMLDQVSDPHNVGAVLRSAAAFGVSMVIVQARHSPHLSGALAKAASGALEYVPVIEAVNLARALDQLKNYYFHCVGFDSAADRLFESAVIAAPKRVCFVFGAEGKGLRRLIREGCDKICALSAPGPIKSLNVSNAAAIVFHSASLRCHGPVGLPNPS